MKRKNPNNPVILMLALGLCLGVLVVSLNDADQTFRHGKLISFKDLSLEFSSNSKPGETPNVSDSAHGLNLISALNVISRFIGTADSVSSDEISLADQSLAGKAGQELFRAPFNLIESISEVRKPLSSRVTVGNFARASL
jgi:hypothetical protein